ncbi:hypothetical protein OVA14_07150 [Agrococcus sp. SL85]|uniref:hypothetical protein n=1 Tax=Agrococcus sp. SL85 TaxID=2995141 RepID=UPI00226C80E6|nr:hypothetical protein [Agrococcus sp. SL85]WAC65169.1 hypothetical protein OVA14_07150 [Agrococcus sp. SL85]
MSVSRSDRIYIDFVATMKAEYAAIDAPCWMDGQPIDYAGDPGQPNSFDLDHVKGFKAHPDLRLERSNVRPSHARCNRSRQDGDPRPPLGQTSEAW